jgi:hypothetical protein
MARLVTSGGEVRDHPTADINSPDGITAGATATTTDTTNQRSGLACLACAGTAANTSFRQWAFTAPALGAQVYGRVYFQVDTLPASLQKVATFTTAAAGALVSVRLNSTGTLSCGTTPERPGSASHPRLSSRLVSGTASRSGC